MIRKLQVSDYDDLLALGEVWKLGRLRFSDSRAREALERATSDARCYCMAEFDGDEMIGAVVIQINDNGFYEKAHASLVIWFGSIELLKDAIGWAMSRPIVRTVSITFDQPVRAGINKLLDRLGFENSGGNFMRWK